MAFRPTSGEIHHFNKVYRPVFDEMFKTLDIENMPCLDFDMIKNPVNCLLLFENSCEEIYLEKGFVKLAVAGRHGKLDCFFRTHNLFHQSK